jgi:hypothetical protein
VPRKDAAPPLRSDARGSIFEACALVQVTPEKGSLQVCDEQQSEVGSAKWERRGFSRALVVHQHGRGPALEVRSARSSLRKVVEVKGGDGTLVGRIVRHGVFRSLKGTRFALEGPNHEHIGEFALEEHRTAGTAGHNFVFDASGDNVARFTSSDGVWMGSLPRTHSIRVMTLAAVVAAAAGQLAPRSFASGIGGFGCGGGGGCGDGGCGG